MKNKILKTLIIVGISLTIMLIFTTVSNAASISISTSKSSVAPGEVFTVTVSLNGGAGPVSASASNGSGSGSQFLDNNSFSFSCTAGSSGSVSISASGTVADYITEQDGDVSNSATVAIVEPQVETPEPVVEQPKPTTTVKQPTTVAKSSNSKLSNLQIAEGQITPEFSSSVKEYAINIPNEITKLSISATTDSSKATVRIRGNEELQVGENTIEIIVKAEDGSSTTYKVLATRAKQELNLQSLNIFIIDENGNKKNLELQPIFGFNVYEYKLKEISYQIKNLLIEAVANDENATIKIIGNDELKTGKNEIEIIVTLTDEAGLEEKKTYKIIVEKEEEPVITPLTTMEKIQKWFRGLGGTVTSFTTKNYEKIISAMLVVATTSFIGLTIYFAFDYKNYQKLLSKLAQLNKTNLMERANDALNPEEPNIEIESKEIIENIEQNKINEEAEIEPKKEKIAKGRRFK